MKEKVILFQGDSITDGNRLRGKENEWDLNHQIGHSYAYMINGELGVRYPEEHLQFYNRGISGNKITDLAARWEEDTLCLKPDVLSVLIGVNDCSGMIADNQNATPEEFEAIYQRLLDEVRQHNSDVKLIICEPFILPVGNVKENWESWSAMMAPLQKAVKRIAEKNCAVFVPLQKKFEELCKVREPEYWIWDGVHPTVCGHKIIAEEWLKCAHAQELFI